MNWVHSSASRKCGGNQIGKFFANPTPDAAADEINGVTTQTQPVGDVLWVLTFRRDRKKRIAMSR